MDMRKVCLLAVAFGMTGYAFAEEPTHAQPAPAAATTETVAPTAATPAVPGKPAMPPANIETPPEPTKSSALEGELDQDKIMAAQKAGYEIRNENGEQLLCRREPKTGSRLRHTVSCMTPKQWEQLQSDTQQTLRTIERRRVGPNNN
jgi:hypothetical protein